MSKELDTPLPCGCATTANGGPCPKASYLFARGRRMAGALMAHLEAQMFPTLNSAPRHRWEYMREGDVLRRCLHCAIEQREARGNCFEWRKPGERWGDGYAPDCTARSRFSAAMAATKSSNKKRRAA